MSEPNSAVDATRRALLIGRSHGVTNRRYASFNPIAAERASRQAMLQRMVPNVSLVDHNGGAVRFYDDVLKGRRVVLSAMYSVCQKYCPPSMSNLIEARRQLSSAALGLTFVTFSLTPLTDGPKELRGYKQRYGIGEDWLFLTGRPEEVDLIQRAQGYAATRITDNELTHASMVRVCDERMMRWGHVNSLTSPQNIARMIRFELA